MAAEEKTFRSYTQEQGKVYAAARPGYPLELFKIIVDHHTSTGGQTNTVVDVGCGTGQAVRDLAPYFANAIGLDPSEGMIDTARAISSSSAEPRVSAIRFEVSSAETIGANLEPPVADGTVDLLTAATAAHWFDMPRFWSRAAQVVRPGGTVALWLRGRPFVCPEKTPNGAAIQAAIRDVLDGEEMRPYKMPGHDITRNFYADLPLPWTTEVPVQCFEKETFVRKEWIRGKEFTEREDSLNTEWTVTPEELVKILGTSSSVTRWEEANPHKIGTEDDILRKLRKRVDNLLFEVGVEPGEGVVRVGVSIVLLMVKKKAE